MLSARDTCRLVEALASRMCGWCEPQCISEGLEGEGPCRHIVRDAYLALLASYSWYPPPAPGARVEELLGWAARSLYYSSVAPLLASRRYSSVIGSRGLFSRRLVERILYDHALLTGYVVYAADYRLPGGWVAIAKLAKCRDGEAETRIEPLGQLGVVARYSCRGGGVSLEVRLEPPRWRGCRSMLESLEGDRQPG